MSRADLPFFVRKKSAIRYKAARGGFKEHNIFGRTNTMYGTAVINQLSQGEAGRRKGNEHYQQKN